MKKSVVEHLSNVEKNKYECVNIELRKIFEEMRSIRRKISVVLEKNKNDRKHKSS